MNVSNTSKFRRILAEETGITNETELDRVMVRLLACVNDDWAAFESGWERLEDDVRKEST